MTKTVSFYATVVNHLKQWSKWMCAARLTAQDEMP